ncbi:uncharacterized protein ATC70_011394 [Mucor velutinosus]|uniref:Uncharacterized protein n=1 Tax=Mucor velutinosus TaxID=708070 RepID=A0AAN7DFC0_9FUNG|nr:hypothetical protein ATC70_011394 [Mucor velutinosus]
MWSKKSTLQSTNNRSAPCTIFSTTTLSPRQIANKAYTLGCKKLDRDDKRSKQQYHVRERLLLCNTISKAEEMLNARTRRTNRRVMSAEDEEEENYTNSSHMKPHHHSNSEHHSPLRNSSDDLDEEEEESIQHTPPSHIPSLSSNITASTTSTSIASSPSTSSTSLPNTTPNSSSSNSNLLPRDCRITITPNSEIVTSPIATII